MRRRSEYLSATALARSVAWGGCSAALLALPLALAPSGARAAAFNVTAVACPAPNGCNATAALVAGNSPINFQGGVLSLNAVGQSYVQPFTLDTSTTNTLNQDGHSTTFTGVFSGAGGNITIGNTTTGGSVTFNAAETYTGTTTVNSGATLKLGTSGAITSTSTLADNGTFDISGGPGAGVTIKDLSGSGTVTLGANTVTLSTASSVFKGAINGAGGLTVSGGTGETLSGANTYTGATTIASGTKLSISVGGSIATSSGVSDGGTFDISGAGGSVTVANVTGAGTVNLGANTLILANTANSSFGGGISGTGGGVTVSGTQRVSLSGALTYAGATTVNTGATLALSGSALSIASLSGGGKVSPGNGNTLTLSNASGTFSGAISGNPTTKLAITGGTESLMGANTYGGATTISKNATLTGSGSVAGNVVNNGTLKPFNTVSSNTGLFAIGGSYTQSSTGILEIALGGTPASGKYGQVTSVGTAVLAGGLDIDTGIGFAIPSGVSTFTSILSYTGSLSGDFTSLAFNGKTCTPGASDTYKCGTNLTFQNVNGIHSVNLQVTRAPEPGTIAILATGLLGLAGLRRRHV